MKFLLTLSFFLLASAGLADELNLVEVKSLKCSFKVGQVASSKNGTYTLKKDSGFDELIFDSINANQGTAKMIGNQGAEDVSVLFTSSGITFVEETSLGNLTFTTVFHQKPIGFNEFAVIHSRHIDMLGVIIPSQYYGTCKRWN